MKKINEDKEVFENTLRHNDEIREEEHVFMDAMREEERVRTEHKETIISSDDESDSGRRHITSEPVTSYHKASTFPAKHKLMRLNMRTYIRMH